MYEDAMNGIHDHLIQESMTGRFTYTAELIPEQNRAGEMSALKPCIRTFKLIVLFSRSWRRTPKQDHLVCFLGGSLMLGATVAGATVDPVSIPPKKKELSSSGERDWKTGQELIRTCLKTHDTAT